MNIVKDYEFFKKLVSENACFLRCVPDSLMSLELCRLSLSSKRNREKALECIPERFFDLCVGSDAPKAPHAA